MSDNNVEKATNEQLAKVFGGNAVIEKAKPKPKEKQPEKAKPAEVVEETTPTEKDDTVVESSLGVELEKSISNLVPESAIAEQREKKRQARAEAEALKTERDQLAQEIEELKKKASPEQAKTFLTMLDDKDPEDAVDVKTVREIISNLSETIGKQAYESGARATNEYVTQREKERAENTLRETQEKLIAKGKADEDEFNKKHANINFGTIFNAAKRRNLITQQEINEIATKPGNMAENIYAKIQENRKDQDVLDTQLSVNSGDNKEKKQGNEDAGVNAAFSSLPLHRNKR